MEDYEALGGWYEKCAGGGGGVPPSIFCINTSQNILFQADSVLSSVSN